jgi:hypothetical protein
MFQTTNQLSIFITILWLEVTHFGIFLGLVWVSISSMYDMMAIAMVAKLWYDEVGIYYNMNTW